MAEPEELDQEPRVPEGGQAVAIKGTQFLKKAYRDLDESELATPAVVRFLLAEIDRLNGEIAELKPYREQSHNLDKRVAILEEKTRA